MAKRQPRTTVCSGCLNEFLDKELYTVSKFINRSNPDPKNVYYSPCCKKCVKRTDSYHEIKLEPKIK